MPGQPSIDIHAHFFPEGYLKLIEAEGAPDGVSCSFAADGIPTIDGGTKGGSPIERRFFDIDVRVEAMDKQNIDIHALSLTTPMVYWASDDLSLRLSQAYNDGCVIAHEKYPDRFVGLAILPMLAPKLALQELERAKDLPGMCGVYMATKIEDKELSDESFFPIYEMIEDLGWTIFLHPVNVVDPDRLKKFYLTNFVGNPTESAIAASHLIFGEVLDKFPKLKVCLPHAGGTFPYLIGRITHGWGVRPECKHLKTAPWEYIRRFYYDTITHAHPQLDFLIDLVGADRVVLGSDFCYDMSYEQPVQFVKDHKGLSDADKDLILGGTSAKLLGLS
jgi:aminocarboxymuconate-semialdehyde decarboxylase